MNSKWEIFGSSNRIRTHIRLVNSHRLLVDCHVVRSSNVWPLRERAGETAERFSVTSPRARKPATRLGMILRHRLTYGYSGIHQSVKASLFPAPRCVATSGPENYFTRIVAFGD